MKKYLLALLPILAVFVLAAVQPTRGELMPPGAIVAFGGSTCPTGWLAADGVAKATATYPALDAYYATTWGARAGGNFQIPDMRGMHQRGAGTQGTKTTGTDANGNAYQAYAGGSVGSYYADRLQGHFHNVYSDSGGGGATNIQTQASTNGDVTVNLGARARTLSADGTNGTPRTGSTTEPQSVVLTYCIKY